MEIQKGGCIAITIESMEAEKALLEKKIAAAEQKLDEGPEGTLVYHESRGKYRYYEQIVKDKKRNRVYLNDNERIMALLRKKLNKAWLKDYKAELAAVEAYLKKSQGMSATESVLSKDALVNILLEGYAEWQNADYEHNTAFPEGLIYQGADGRMVRSKSEGDMDWGLKGGKLPNRYEPKLVLGGQKVYPDFQIIHPVTKRIILWEHFGKMDDPDYEARTYEKIQLYREHDYFPGDNLIMTFEDKKHPLTNVKIQQTIENYFGDWLEIIGR